MHPLFNHNSEREYVKNILMSKFMTFTAAFLFNHVERDRLYFFFGSSVKICLVHYISTTTTITILVIVIIKNRV